MGRLETVQDEAGEEEGAIIRSFNTKLRILTVGPTASSVCCFRGGGVLLVWRKNWSTAMEKARLIRKLSQKFTKK